MILRLLQPSDDRSAFSCGEPDYVDFLRKYAGQNQFTHHISSTLVVVEDERVVGYATIALGEISRDAMPAEGVARFPRYPLPVLRLGRLAVDERMQGRGLGLLLVREVLLTALRLRAEYGCVAVVVDALNERVAFYENLGFRRLEPLVGRSPIPGTVLMALPLAQVDAAIRDASPTESRS